MLRICATFVLLFLPVTALAGLGGVVRVIDADTWMVGEETVRLFGVDAPEMAQLCQDRQGRDWACGKWVTDQVRQRFDGRVVSCERIATDRYRRTVARCFFKNRDVAREIVAQGLAFAYRRYSSDYVAEELAASSQARGLHASQTETPARFRARKKAPQGKPALRGCLLKGNISSNGERIFHQPGQQYYARTRISVARGERWFCSDSDALAAGWRRALR